MNGIHGLYYSRTLIQGVPKVMCQTFGLISQLRIVRFQKFLRERAGIFTHSRNMSKAIKSKFIFCVFLPLLMLGSGAFLHVCVWPSKFHHL